MSRVDACCNGGPAKHNLALEPGLAALQLALYTHSLTRNNHMLSLRFFFKATTYGSCITGQLNTIAQGACEAEFRRLAACMKQHAAKG